MTAEFNIVNAFTVNGNGGNPAGVVLNAEAYTTIQKQAIAAKAGLSETAFISKSAIADFKLEFFTPNRQIPHCGHATIASFYFLNESGKIGGRNKLTKETIDGTRDIYFNDGEVYMQQKAPIFTNPEEEDIVKIYSSLGLAYQENKPLVVNTGNSFILLHVDTEDTLANLKPDFNAIAELSEKYEATGFYIFTLSDTADATARMFAPAYGINEEAATGMAAGPLACYLYKFVKQQNEYAIQQGKFMEPSSASLINVKLQLSGSEITSLYAGGKAALVKKEHIKL